MSKKEKKKQRELAAKAERARRENEIIARCPLSREELTSLYSFVGEAVVEKGHNSDYTHTNQWIDKSNIEEQKIHAFLLSIKIKNDWDVLLNADPLIIFGSSSTRHVTMPLEMGELEDLLDFIDEKLESTKCKHNTLQAEEWIKGSKYEIPKVLAALYAQGGFCDCEIVMNVEPDEIYV